MSARLLRLAVGRLEQTFRRPAVAARSDGRLLGDFIARHDEAAFAELLRRHGAMVFGVCRRALGDRHDAEDAFQATFLVLARKASRLARREAVAGWLYGVALRTARKARSLNARRRRHEAELGQRLPSEASPAAAGDWRPVLDEEVGRLPEKYRLPVLLCDLEGRSRREAAAALQLPEGTLSSRLARAHGLLRGRLVRRGLALPAGGLAGLVATESAPAGLVGTTARVAALCAAGRVGELAAPVAVLTEGVLQAMRLTRLKLTAAALAAVTVIGGVGWGTRPGTATVAGIPVAQAGTGSDAAPPRPSGPKAPAGGDHPAAPVTEDDLQALQGSWAAVSVEIDGQSQPTEHYANCKLEIIGQTIRVATAEPLPFSLDVGQRPKRIDWNSGVGNGAQAIYLLTGDTLVLCVKIGGGHPAEFTARAGSGQEMIVFRRQSPPAKAADPAAASADDRQAILGTWVPVSAEVDGKNLPASEFGKQKVEFTPERIFSGDTAASYRLDTDHEPRRIETKALGKDSHWIYALAGDTLLICRKVVNNDPEPPTTFTGRAGSKQALYVYRREVAPAKAAPRPVVNDAQAIQGTWTIVSAEFNGEPSQLTANTKVQIIDNAIWIVQRSPMVQYRLSPEQRPKGIQLLTSGARSFGGPDGIFLLEGDALILCFKAGQRPDNFTARAGSNQTLWVLRRGGPAAPERPPETAVISLRNAAAAEAANVLQTMFYGGDKSGGLRITTDSATNTLFVQGSPAQIAQVRRTVEMIDVPGAANAEFTVIPVQKVKASELAEALRKHLTGPLSSTTIGVDDRTNQLLVRGSENQVKAVRELVGRMMNPPGSAPAGPDQRAQGVKEAQERVKALRAELTAAEERLRRAEEASKRDK